MIKGYICNGKFIRIKRYLTISFVLPLELYRSKLKALIK